MALLRAMVQLAHVSGLAEDKATNTFHFSTLSNPPSVLELNAIRDRLIDVYTTIPPGAASALQSFFSTEMAQIGHTISFYDLADPEPRVPVRVDNFSLTVAPNGDPLPGEVAVCMSFQGALESGLKQARRRGRIYHGRFDKDSSSAGRPSDPLMDTLQANGLRLVTASEAAADWSWIVLSREHVTSAEDPRPSYPQTFAVVTNGWVDNAFDTQRRRGLAPTIRQTFDPV